MCERHDVESIGKRKDRNRIVSRRREVRAKPFSSTARFLHLHGSITFRGMWTHSRLVEPSGMAARGGGKSGSGEGAPRKGGIGRGSWQGSNPSITGGGGSSSSGGSRPSSRGGPTSGAASSTAATSTPSTPKQESNKQPGREPSSFSNYLDLPVRLTLVASSSQQQQPREATGILFAYDQSSSTVVLVNNAEGSAQSSKRSYQLVKTSQIKDVTVVSTTPDSSSSSFAVDTKALANVNQRELTARVEKAVIEDQRRRARIGPPGVSPEGQSLFDALARTLPVRWHEHSISMS